MTKEKYMALADLQTLWTGKIKPWISSNHYTKSEVYAKSEVYTKSETNNIVSPITNEIGNARGSYQNLDARLDAMEADIENRMERVTQSEFDEIFM